MTLEGTDGKRFLGLTLSPLRFAFPPSRPALSNNGPGLPTKNLMLFSKDREKLEYADGNSVVVE
jgi:hypothetical protein